MSEEGREGGMGVLEGVGGRGYTNKHWIERDGGMKLQRRVQRNKGNRMSSGSQ